MHEHCGHDHQHNHSCGCGHEHRHRHSNELPEILIGAGLLISGLLLQALVKPPFYIAAFAAAYLLLGWKVLWTAGKHILKGQIFDENFLMSIATLGAFAIREFPEAVGIMLFYRVGEYFEEQAVERSRRQIIDAADLRPQTVTLESGQIILAEDAKIGDVLTVRPGDRIPLDGVVLAGSGRLDTAPITGEPVPVGVQAGSHVLSGCINLSGVLTLRVEKPLQDSLVTRILHSVQEASASKPKIDRFITRFARIYTPIVVALAATTAVIPSLITGNWDYWVYTALSFLVMSCPCALVLSVPLAFFSGIGAGSRRGILFKGGLSMEALSKVRTVVMDKTGTLTVGAFTVLEGSTELLALCAACEQHSTHPIAQSILAEAQRRGIRPEAPETLEELAGMGIRATLHGAQLLCGSEKLLTDCGIAVPKQAPGVTVVHIARDGRYLGAIRLGDRIKDDAKSAVSRLQRLGLFTVMLTGDGAESAAAVAKELGIGAVYAQLLPHEKLEHLYQIRQEHGSVLFVGDGINDAPVLAGADVGAAMGSGADAAIEAADAVFMNPRVGAIPQAIRIARRTKAIAWQNVIFALTVKLLVMALGLLGFASMWAAVFADTGVAMLCILNSIRALKE